MKWKLVLEIIGMATALAALFGVFGILLNVFFEGEYFVPVVGVTIVEPHILILILELVLILVSIPVMIFVGLKDIKGLVKIKNPQEEMREEKTASRIFVRSILIGLTLALIVGLIIYVDDMSYRNEKLKYNNKKMDQKIAELNGTIAYLEIELDEKERIVQNLTEENKLCIEET